MHKDYVLPATEKNCEQLSKLVTNYLLVEQLVTHVQPNGMVVDVSRMFEGGAVTLEKDIYCLHQ
jgi:hypothetical protein